MPITRPSSFRTGPLLAAALFAVGAPISVNAAPAANVSVVRSAPWSPGDASRDGAGEFSVLLEVAQLQRTGAPVGLIGVGATRGVFTPGAERALRFAVLSGVPVVKLAPDGDVAHSPDELFVNAGNLTEAEARRHLADALARHGAAPRAANPAQPTEPELTSIRAHVRRLQQEFAASAAVIVASR